MTTFVTRIAAAAAIALAALPVVAVSAAHAEDRTAVIGVADLDFARPTDIERFEGRIRNAADKVCPAPGRAGLRAAAVCGKDVRHQAFSKLGHKQHARIAAAAKPALAFSTASN